MCGARAWGGVGQRVGPRDEVHRIIRAVGVPVSRRISESAGPAQTKSALDRGAIVYVVETGSAKCVVARNSGCAERAGVCFFDCPGANRSRASRGVELDEPRVTVG